MAVRRADGPARGLGSTEGLRPLGVDTAAHPGGEYVRPHTGPNQRPANRSTREGNIVTGCAITGMPTASGIPRLQPWEEVNCWSHCRFIPRPLEVGEPLHVIEKLVVCVRCGGHIEAYTCEWQIR